MYLSQTAFAQLVDLPLHKDLSGGDTIVHFTHDFSVYGRVFTPVGQVSVAWHHTTSTFAVSGDVTTDLDSTIVTMKMSASSSYFQLNADSAIIAYTPNVMDTFVLSGQKFIGLLADTWLTYSPSKVQEYIYGDTKILLDNVPHNARLGSTEDPGGILVNNEPTTVWVHLENLSLKGLNTTDITKTDVILRHEEDDDEGTYHGYGTWAVLLMETLQIAVLGNAQSPGLTIKYGNVTRVDMKAGGFGLIFGALPVIDVYSVSYNEQSNKYAITGNLTIGVPFGGVFKAFGAKYAPSFQIQAGDADNPGFLLNPSNGKFEVADATFSLNTINGATKVELGGIALHDLAIRVRNNIPDSMHAQGTFPPGFSVAVSLGFYFDIQKAHPERFFVNTIHVTWQATNFEQALPLSTTGFSIVKIAGGVTNLDFPAMLSLDVELGLIYGEPATFNVGVFGIPGLTGDRELAIVYIEGDAELSAKGLSFTAIGDCGAVYQLGEWTGLVAELEAGVDFKWGGSVILDASLSMYAPPNDFMNSHAKASFHSSGDIDAIGSATLQIPHIIPIIGGKHLANAHFALRHKGSDPDQSYGAGWTRFNLGFDHITAGAKANFKSGKVTKVGAAEARAITKQNISDDEQHPVGSDGEPDLDWYACGIKSHFTIPSGSPAAYLQNQIVINNNLFHDSELNYYGPAMVTITSPSNSEDLKNLTPADEYDVYGNQGQTTVQDNTMSIDFTQNKLEGGSDTIRFITVNEAVESYSSIDWVNQPELLLIPGQYILTLSGYCPVGGFPLLNGDMHYNASPVYPMPTIAMTGDDAGTFTIDYSAYITDSTTVSLYWNYNQDSSGNLIAHLPYHDGVLVGDSLYRWVVEDWDPGIAAEKTIYFYAVIDDYINSPVRTGFDSVKYTETLQVNVYGANDSTQVLLSPADTTLSDIYGVNNGNGHFLFTQMPLGIYTVHCFNETPGLVFTHNMDMTDIDGNVLSKNYHSPDWVSLEIEVVTWDNGIGGVYFYLEPGTVPLFGEVTDTSGVSVGDDARVFIINDQNVITYQSSVDDIGYRLPNIDTGYVSVAFRLPFSNTYHWPPTSPIRYRNIPGLTGIVYQVDSVHVNDISKAIDLRVLPGAQGPIFIATDLDNHAVENVVVSIHRQDGNGAVLQAVTDANGLAFFDGSEVATFINYVFTSAWPDAYRAVTPQNQTFQWSGTTDPQVVVGNVQ